MNEEQYKLIFARRVARDGLVWQTPTLSMAVQAVLLTAAFRMETGPTTALLLFGFSFLVGAASIQLMMKHRFLERIDDALLAEFEELHKKGGYVVAHGPNKSTADVNPNFLATQISFNIWIEMLGGFCLLAAYGYWSRW